VADIAVADIAGIGTAIGTLVLAIATFALARRAGDQSKAAHDQAAASLEQATLADRALRAQTAPLLTDVPYGIPEITGYHPKSRTADRKSEWILASAFGPQEPAYGDASGITVLIDENGGREVFAAVPFRNIGNGAAIVQSVTFVSETIGTWPGAPSTPVLAPGQVGRARLEMPPGAPDYDVARALAETTPDFSVIVEYADAAGELRGAVRIDLSRFNDGEGEDWLVRQVHWDKDRDAVQGFPRLSSQPGF
jgi:hypothetical protein